MLAALKRPGRNTHSGFKAISAICDGHKLSAKAPSAAETTQYLHLLSSLCQPCPAVTQQLHPSCTAKYSHTGFCCHLQLPPLLPWNDGQRNLSTLERVEAPAQINLTLPQLPT